MYLRGTGYDGVDCLRQVQGSVQWRALVSTIMDLCNNVRSGLLGFRTLSIVGYSKDHKRIQRFGNSVCFCPQVKGWEADTLLGPLERANLNHWTQQSRCLPPPHLRTETDPSFRNELFFSIEGGLFLDQVIDR
jgi:hypothetical protein